LQKEESKVEKSVQALKESADKKKSVVSDQETAIQPTKKTLTQRFVAVVKHYYHGFRLLLSDVRISSKLLWKILKGKTLTRREHNQLVRTTADLFRLVPLAVFIIIPFAELLLPVVLTIFPNMLPSTFQEEKDQNVKNKRNLKAKIEMAKFLQKTIKECAPESKKKNGEHTGESFGNFIESIRTEGVRPNTSDIMKFAKLFEDEITLDNLTRPQLRACCTMLGITPIGTDALLRFLLEMKLRGLLADDRVIQQEGVHMLNTSELQSANRARGMRALGMSEERLREQLKQWLQLRLEYKIPTSLLLLSRALYLPDTLSMEEKITTTIKELPNTATTEAKMKAAEIAGEKVDNKTRLDIIKHEEEIIAAEKQQRAEETKLIQEKEEREKQEAIAAERAMEAIIDTAKTLDPAASEVLMDKAEPLEPISKKVEKETIEITAQDIDEMESVLEKVATVKQIDIIGDDLNELKEEVIDYKEDLEDLKDAAVAKDKIMKQSKAAKNLSKKVEKMISKLDKTIDNIQEGKKGIQEKLSQEEKSLAEELEDKSLSQQQIKKYESSLVSLNDLMEILKNMKKDEEKLEKDEAKLIKIFEAIDIDKDGNIDVNEALDFLEVMSKDQINLSEAQVEEINVVLKHEDMLSDIQKEQEKKEKEALKDQGQ